MFKSSYRIVTDSYNGYEAQKRYWWSPFWIQMGNPCNTHSSVESAEAYVKRHAQIVVKEVQV